MDAWTAPQTPHGMGHVGSHERLTTGREALRAGGAAVTFFELVF